MKKVKAIPVKLSWLKSIYQRTKDFLGENIHGVWLLRPRVSIVGYVLLFIICSPVVTYLHENHWLHPWLHPANSSEIIIGIFTLLFALLLPLAIAIIQGDNNPLVRQTLTTTVMRFGWMSVIVAIVCFTLVVPAKIYVDIDISILKLKTTARSMTIPFLAVGFAFMLASLYRSVRWLRDEAMTSGLFGEVVDKDTYIRSFASYRFACIVRALGNAKKSYIWQIVWSQQFSVSYEAIIHEAFFDRINKSIKSDDIKQYSLMLIELEAYQRNFAKRNQNSYKFASENPKRFFLLYDKIHRINEAYYRKRSEAGFLVDDNAIKSIASDYINLLVKKPGTNGVWNLFQAMNVYTQEVDLVVLHDEIKKDWLVETFLEALFNSIKDSHVQAYSIKEHFGERSPWAVTYEHLFGNGERYNLSFLVMEKYWEWLQSSLEDLGDHDYFFKNDSLVEIIFPETSGIIMGKLYWLLHLSHSSDYLDLWITKHCPIGLMSSGPTLEYANDIQERSRQIAEQKEANTFKLFCRCYYQYIHSLDLENTINQAESKDTAELDEAQKARLDDFIMLAEKIVQTREELLN
jgi:hypothetical protein